jgi:hypothetical protein
VSPQVVPDNVAAVSARAAARMSGFFTCDQHADQYRIKTAATKASLSKSKTVHATIFDWAGLVAETADAKSANVRIVIEREKAPSGTGKSVANQESAAPYAYRSMMTLVATRAIAAGEQLLLHSS